ncbi:phage tail tube protein [Evansella cellulosilytica]|uniref:Phage major tail protein, TP901-1 family n=1 Tax=Evansella cellulosilytica (strain ATCC 21833 / DSM 2522 / FERM P-1141 / JCM 9156 / N-4) TaxID=649639 RepID=E6U1K1_EVAC2|nr:phage major tail protein, TP901-1 family [Evansella cellulosilytica]ADU30364.1 phage major tail protein, TP901-1 family [Evansella cellulosilytica DSM 2522]
MAKKVKGVQCKIYVVDDIESENPTILAGQRNATLNRSAETMDSTAKDSDGGWKENEAGFKEWSVDADGLLVESDDAYDLIEDRFNASEKIGVIATLPNGKKYLGTAVITDFPIDMPYEDLATYSTAFTGSGALRKESGTVEQ